MGAFRVLLAVMLALASFAAVVSVSSVPFSQPGPGQPGDMAHFREGAGGLVGSLDSGGVMSSVSVDSVGRSFLGRNRAYLGVDPASLQFLGAERDAPLYRGQGGVWYSVYRQLYRGVPVEGAFVVLAFVDGKLVRVNSEFVEGVRVNVLPSIRPEEAVSYALSDAGVVLAPRNVSLVVLGNGSSSRLAWRVELPLDKGLGGAWVYYVDAHSGSVIGKFNSVVFGSVHGFVSGMVLPEHWRQNFTLVNFSNNSVSVYQAVNSSVFFSGRAKNLLNSMSTLRQVSLSGYSDVNLTIRVRFELENSFDFAYLRVSANGSSWQTLASFTGNQSSWVSRNYSLNNYIGHSVFVNLTATTDSLLMNDGFFFDNLSIVTDSSVVFFEDANSSSNWSLAGFQIVNDSVVNSSLSNISGFFNVSGVEGNVTVLSYLKSPWIRVVDNDASFESNHSDVVNSSLSLHSWNWNSSDRSYSLEMSNAFYHANRIHDYFTNGTPFNVTGLNYEMAVSVQDDTFSNCNAFYSAPNIFFAGAGGGCNATSLSSDVVYHEYVHAAVDVMYVASMSSGEPGAMNEGFADYFAATLNGNGCLAEEWDSVTPCLRYLNNSDKKPSSFTEVHADSTPFSGALWDLRLRVGNTKADDLVVRAMKVQSQSFSGFLDDVLTMDDNNTDLNDGTPNRHAICVSFSSLHSINSSSCSNSVPNISGFSPSSLSVVLSSPDNQSFLINYSDSHNDVVFISWLVNGSNQSSFYNRTSFNFTNSSLGSYNVTVIVSDWNSSSFFNWTVLVNNTIPVWNFTPANYSFGEDSELRFNVSASDFDNQSIRYFVNDSRFNVTGAVVPQGVNATVNFTPAADFSGVVFANFSAFDGFINISQAAFFNVTAVNDAPVWNVSPSNFTMLEDSELRFNVSGNDVDGDLLRYFVNDSRFNVSGASFGPGVNVTVNFTPAMDFNGSVPLNVSVSDGSANLSMVVVVVISPVNDAPVVVQQPNITVNESDWVNVSVSASDVEDGFFNFSINYSGFSQPSPGNFSWKTNLSGSGGFSFAINVTDGNLTSVMVFNASVLDRADSDLDGVPDIYDSDDDNDGVPDGADYLMGVNSSFLNASQNVDVSFINISVNGSLNLSQLFNGTFLVNVSNGSVPVVEFFWNFTNSSLGLNFSIDFQSSGSAFGAVFVKGLVLQFKKNLSLLAVNSSIGSVCVKDADVGGISNISASCSALNESLVTCPGINGSYSCSLVNSTGNSTYFKISGLSFSAAKQQCPDSDSDGYYVSGCGSGNDCNDVSPSVNPGASEVCGDGVDNDCSGSDLVCSSGSSYGGGGVGGGGGGSSSSSKSS
ncbi:immune inhibitor A, partial [Candidatus Woesearchaeota archaeon]|nr:immune inhibitor A [Candidatus Woesearchaeota archaeon]